MSRTHAHYTVRSTLFLNFDTSTQATLAATLAALRTPTSLPSTRTIIIHNNAYSSIAGQPPPVRAASSPRCLCATDVPWAVASTTRTVLAARLERVKKQNHSGTRALVLHNTTLLAFIMLGVGGPTLQHRALTHTNTHTHTNTTYCRHARTVALFIHYTNTHKHTRSHTHVCYSMSERKLWRVRSTFAIAQQRSTARFLEIPRTRRRQRSPPKTIMNEWRRVSACASALRTPHTNDRRCVCVFVCVCSLAWRRENSHPEKSHST